MAWTNYPRGRTSQILKLVLEQSEILPDDIEKTEDKNNPSREEEKQYIVEEIVENQDGGNDTERNEIRNDKLEEIFENSGNVSTSIVNTYGTETEKKEDTIILNSSSQCNLLDDHDEDSIEDWFQSSGSEYKPSHEEEDLEEEEDKVGEEQENQEILSGEESDPTVDGRKKKRKSKGQGVPTQWKRFKNSSLRLKGAAYVGFKKTSSGKYQQTEQREKRAIQPKCNSHPAGKKGPNQKFECSEISEEQRKKVFTSFWNLSTWEAKKLFVMGQVVQTIPKHRRNTSDAELSRKQIGFKYYLNVNKNAIETEKKHVCKKMFLATLNIGEKSVRSWMQKDGPSGHLVTDNVESNYDSSCSKSVEEFLEKLPKVESHYCRSSSKKLYLEPAWESYRRLHKEFIENCRKENKRSASWRTFMKIFRKMNLEIFCPKKDQCNDCSMYKNGNLNEEDYQKHRQRTSEAREEKERDKTEAIENGNVCSYTVDLQAVLLSPRLNASANYYKTKLKVHNLTYYNLQSKDVVCFVWHEGNGGLESDVFASIATKFIRSEIEKNGPSKIIIWSDGCCYQNRNVKLANALLESAIENKINIEQKYLEVGHTQMEVDSIHSTIERKLRRKREVYIPADYLQIIKSARENPYPYNAVSLSYSDFYQYDPVFYSSIRPGKKKGDPCVNDICALQYTPEGLINYKLKFSEAWTELPTRPKHAVTPIVHPLLYIAPCAIEASKFQHLQELKALIPSDYHSFYDNLAHK